MQTCIAYREVVYEPMLKQVYSKEFNTDTIIFNFDYSVVRFFRKKRFDGMWKINNERSEIVIDLANCVDCYFSRNTGRFYLTDSTLEMKYLWGRECENSVRIFRTSK